MEQMSKIYEVEEWENTSAGALVPHLSILHNWTAAAFTLRWWIQRLECVFRAGAACRSQGFASQGVVRDWKGLRCNAFQMKWKGAKGMKYDMLAAGAWSPGSHRSGLYTVYVCTGCVCVCVCLCVWVWGSKCMAVCEAECVMWCRLPLLLWLPLPAASCSGLMEIKGH